MADINKQHGLHAHDKLQDMPQKPTQILRLSLRMQPSCQQLPVHTQKRPNDTEIQRNLPIRVCSVSK